MTGTIAFDLFSTLLLTAAGGVIAADLARRTAFDVLDGALFGLIGGGALIALLAPVLPVGAYSGPAMPLHIAAGLVGGGAILQAADAAGRARRARAARRLAEELRRAGLEGHLTRR